MNSLNKSIAMKQKKGKYLFEATHFADPIIERGKGSLVWDVDGNQYYDLNAGQFCMSFGHGYEPFIECVTEQMKRIYHTNTSTLSPEVFIAAEKMASITDYKLTKTLFLSTGSEANECAMRYARFITGREGIVGFEQGYHGLTLGSQAITMGGQWARPHVQKVFSVMTPDYIHSDRSWNEDDFIDICISDLRNAFKEHGQDIAAVIMEPVVGVGGMVSLPHRYMREVRKLCNEYSSILIFDECQCGFGRSGDWFAYQQAGVLPDILVSAKAMGMGFAVSAVTFDENISKKIEGNLVHFSSHQNDPIAAAIVSFVIDEINNDDLLYSNQKKGEYLLNCIRNICSKTDAFCNPRGLGLMCAFDIDDNIIHDYRQYSARFIKALEKNGVLIQAIRQGRTFRVMPNYFITEDEIDYVENAIIKSIGDVV